MNSARRTIVALGLTLLLGGRNTLDAAGPGETSPAGGMGVSAKVGTLGIGGELTIGIHEYLGLRLGGNAFSWERGWRADEGTVYTDMEWLSWSGLLDLHPFGGGFRISGGALLNQNKLKLRADLDEPVDLSGSKYELRDLRGEVTFEDVAPYVGIGYGNAAGRDGRWHFTCDFGVMFQGEPRVDAWARAADPRLQRVVDRALDEELRDIRKDARDFRYYPVISCGVSFRF